MEISARTKVNGIEHIQVEYMLEGVIHQTVGRITKDGDFIIMENEARIMIKTLENQINLFLARIAGNVKY